jgi:mannose-6-phosphate isomerase-like protein (cupin superfamily)
MATDETAPLLTVIDIAAVTNTAGAYTNLPLAWVNNHVVRVSVMTEAFYWHLHPNSDETFLVVEGVVVIDLADATVELQPGQLFTIPKNTPHRTRPKGARSVNLTFESADMETVRVEGNEDNN